MQDNGTLDYGTHPDYVARSTWTHFDDRPFADEWQDGVYDYAFRTFQQRGYRTVADFGCGSGYKLVKYFPPGATIGVELEPALSYVENKYPGRIWRSGDHPEAALRGADMIICSDVIEHLPNPAALLDIFASSQSEFFIISTPALEMMADRNLSPRLGPPSNESHIREWSTQEFYNLVSRYFKVVEQRITNVQQCTQMIAAIKK